MEPADRALAKDRAGDARLIPCARAKFSFEAKSEVELDFSVGVSLRLLRRIDDNWLEGEMDGRVGIFPAAYVDIELSIPSKARENELAKSGRPYAIGLFEFSGDCGGDLPFAKGELIELLGSVGSGWMRGKTGKGEGIFPSSFVEVLKLPVAPNGETSPPASPEYASPSAGGPSSRRSPEYALPGEPPARGTCLDGVLDEGTDGERAEAVFENGFSEEGEGDEDETQPVPTSQKTSSCLEGDGGEGVGSGNGRMAGATQTPPAPPLEPGTSPPTRQVRLFVR